MPTYAPYRAMPSIAYDTPSFEATNWMLRDAPSVASSLAELEQYYNDVYHLLQYKLVMLTRATGVSSEDVADIKSLTNELLLTKRKLQAMAQE